MLALVWYGYITQRDISHVCFEQFDEEISDKEYRIVLEAAQESVQEAESFQWNNHCRQRL